MLPHKLLFTLSVKGNHFHARYLQQVEFLETLSLIFCQVIQESASYKSCSQDLGSLCGGCGGNLLQKGFLTPRFLCG